ncbi:MAG TPA: DNA/RNA non-specific endonuclease [Pyrinomonadaceae bacterium]|nr:DNA/RNA non-specific endonuclease [Pyrinomonadaceae bacterium]
MATADLTRKATLASMQRLVPEITAAEAPGHEPETPAEVFQGRNGYNPNFLNGWSIPLPKGIGNREADMRRLRRGGTGVELTYRNFSVIMSSDRRLPMMTAANINGLESRHLPRIDTWSFDGRLDKTDQWGDAIYFNNQLDRGHMVRREDPIWGTLDLSHEANEDTFHFTNSCPQMAGVNQVTWLGLEDHILQNARADGMQVNVYTGPFFRDNDLEYRGARIPGAFWKVVAIVTEDGRPSATAYKVDQVQELSDLEFVFAGYKTFQISIKQVIDEAQIDFSTLLEYDGFSQHESASGQRVVELIESLNNIRI